MPPFQGQSRKQIPQSAVPATEKKYAISQVLCPGVFAPTSWQLQNAALSYPHQETLQQVPGELTHRKYPGILSRSTALIFLTPLKGGESVH